MIQGLYSSCGTGACGGSVSTLSQIALGVANGASSSSGVGYVHWDPCGTGKVKQGCGEGFWLTVAIIALVLFYLLARPAPSASE